MNRTPALVGEVSNDRSGTITVAATYSISLVMNRPVTFFHGELMS